MSIRKKRQTSLVNFLQTKPRQNEEQSEIKESWNEDTHKEPATKPKDQEFRAPEQNVSETATASTSFQVSVTKNIETEDSDTNKNETPTTEVEEVEVRTNKDEDTILREPNQPDYRSIPPQKQGKADE